jgi:UDP-3-O-[3-hydroxymyristoyl] glucosamine N-acyltransferase
MNLSSPLTLAETATLLGCEYVGPASHAITGLNEIHMVRPGDLTFVDVEKYYRKALESAATTILINQAVEPPPGKGLLISEQPFRDYNRLTNHFQPEQSVVAKGSPKLGPGVKLGEQVVMGEDVEIGEGTEIGHGVVIGSHVRIGKNCRIYPRVSINDHCFLGDEVCLNSGVVLGGEAFYFKSLPDRKHKLLTKGRVIIHDHVDIGANTTVDRGVSGDTIIGEYTKLDNLIQVAHDVQIGKRCVIAAQCGIAGCSVIEDDVVLLGQVGVIKEMHIGKGALVNSKSLVIQPLAGGKQYFGWVARETRQTMRELVATRKLPDLLKKIEGLLRQDRGKTGEAN